MTVYSGNRRPTSVVGDVPRPTMKPLWSGPSRLNSLLGACGGVLVRLKASVYTLEAKSSRGSCRQAEHSARLALSRAAQAAGTGVSLRHRAWNVGAGPR